MCTVRPASKSEKVPEETSKSKTSKKKRSHTIQEEDVCGFSRRLQGFWCVEEQVDDMVARIFLRRCLLT
jgi:hypothetical protein